MIEGLNLVDIYTEQEEGRLIDNIVLDSELVDMPVVMEINRSERFCTELEMMVKAVMKVLCIRM